VPAAPPPPKPDSFVVSAYKRRKKIPFWAMLALSLLPIWAFMYARSVTTQVVEAAGPLGLGETTYGGCASCHGGDGSGGVGYPFMNGEVLKTFPHIEDQLRYVYYGTEQYNAAGVEIYGDPNREGGAHVTGARNVMPAQGAAASGGLTDYEILAVVCHERYTLGGADPTGDYLDEYEQWCAEGSEIFADLEGGGDLRDLETRFDGIIPIGMAPVAGTTAGE
jgi:mono/diheme cytochrome c family protein